MRAYILLQPNTSNATTNQLNVPFIHFRCSCQQRSQDMHLDQDTHEEAGTIERVSFFKSALLIFKKKKSAFIFADRIRDWFCFVS